MDEREENGSNPVDAGNDARQHPLRASAFFAFSEKLSASVNLRWLMISLLPVLILLKYPVDRIDYDVWWQMAHGQYYLMHHTLKMDLSMFSWTPTDPTWIYNTCLGSIAVYLFYHWAEGFGLWLFQWLIFSGVFLSFYLFLRSIHQRLDINSATVIAAVAMACSISCRYYKPELFSALLFCWTAYIFFHIKIRGNRYLFYLFPPIFTFWVNLHGAFIVGLAFLGLAFAGEFLNRIFFPKKSLKTEDLMHFGLALILSGAATLLNPYGIDYLKSLVPTIMHAVGVGDYSGPYDKFVLAYASLWPYLKKMGPELFGVGMTAWILTLMMMSIACLVAYELMKHKSCDFALCIVSLAMYWKGMETSRASYFFPIVFFFIFYYLLVSRLQMAKFGSRATVFSIMVFIFFFGMVSFFNIKYGADNKWFGRDLDGYVPVQEVEFLKKYKLPGPVFNDYVIGGYLLWKLYPDYKVFIDPRGGLYRNQVFPDYMEFTIRHVSRDDIRRFREKYPFNIAILHYRQMALIFDFLKAGDDWRFLYFEKNAAILIHQSLLPLIEPIAGNISLSPIRFKHVRNPEILINVFNFYVRLDPRAGRYIYYVFKRNVSDGFFMKKETLTAMDSNIRLKEKAFQERPELFFRE
ncbi:MAG TPA: hypothetical protein PLL41_03800 [Smithella sp.]|nr:hypothetical protein [Smithella sp.]